MAYTSDQDWAVGGLCSGASSDGDLNLSEEYLIIVLFSLEWLVFVGFLGFLTCQLVMKNMWKKEEGQEVDDLAMLQKPPPINENLQQEDEVKEHELHDYAEDDRFEFNFNEDFCEDLDFRDYLTKEDSKEEEEEEEEKEEDEDDNDDDYEDYVYDDDDDDDDFDDSASVSCAVNGFLSEEVKYKLSYFFCGIDVLDSHSMAPDEPTVYETLDEASEGVVGEELWGRSKTGDFGAWPYNDWHYEDEE